jgi:hypothetical protein
MIKRELTELTFEHCHEVLRRDILIGSAYTLDGHSKSFVFNPFFNEYRVMRGDAVIESGQAVEELLTVYNEL